MLRKLRQRINEEKGFTLIELLVVILIIGILAAIALPAFLGQQKKGQDADAKSLARNMVSQVESCYATEQAYANCTNASPSITDSSLPIGAGQGQVSVGGQSDAAPGPGFTVTALSRSGATFTITKAAAGTTRGCNRAGQGGCKNDGTW